MKQIVFQHLAGVFIALSLLSSCSNETGKTIVETEDYKNNEAVIEDTSYFIHIKSPKLTDYGEGTHSLNFSIDSNLPDYTRLTLSLSEEAFKKDAQFQYGKIEICSLPDYNRPVDNIGYLKTENGYWGFNKEDFKKNCTWRSNEENEPVSNFPRLRLTVNSEDPPIFDSENILYKSVVKF